MKEAVQPVEQVPKISLYPCIGRTRLGVPPRHVYNVRIGDESVGFFPLDFAIATYPQAIIIQSASLCSSCEADLRSTN